MSKTKNIVYNLSLLRKSLKLSQASLADEINVSKSMINHIENSENDSALVHYIYYLRMKGFDLNRVFEDDNFEKFKNEYKNK